jgi:putative transposase
MTTISYVGYRFPREIIQHAVWIYLGFTLSYRDVEELLAERGIDVSHETIRRWVIAFGLRYAQRLRAKRPKPSSAWHLDEMFVSIGGKRMNLWRAVDAEGEVTRHPRPGFTDTTGTDLMAVSDQCHLSVDSL